MRPTSVILDAGGAPMRVPVQRRSNPGRTLVIERVGPRATQGYSSVSRTSRDNRSYSQYAGDQHLRYDREKLINQSRALLRDNEIYKGMVEQAVDYIVSTGLPLQGTNASNALNEQIEGLWNEWWACLLISVGFALAVELPIRMLKRSYRLRGLIFTRMLIGGAFIFIGVGGIVGFGEWYLSLAILAFGWTILTFGLWWWLGLGRR